ncbi:dienelactone hydrolase family protein [bacterium]|nr:dienelactone hydrolase family protein [bacterium]MCI0618299.1 dienelactone hydrolase family protein [bacterium]
MKKLLAIVLFLFVVLPVFSQEYVKQRLEKSPRHSEWVDVKNGNRAIHSFVVYPQSKEKATAVIVIHENRGLTDWVRGVADQVAETGYIAIAPDLLSGMGPKGGNTSDFADEDAAREGIYKLEQPQVTSDLNAVADYVIKLPASNGKLAVAGFCWGGGQTLRFATNRPDLKAAFVFYGSFEHTKEDIARIKSPVYGFYGGNDERIGATIPGTTEQMKAAGKTYEPVTYEGAAHGFMRSGEDPAGPAADKDARTKALERWKNLLKKI